MPLSDILFTLLIGPLRTLFEIIYTVSYRLTVNPGLAIIGLSLAMNLLLLPLYNRTDVIQFEAIATEKRLRPYVSHIKKTFRGNEQFMMLQTCYRQNHYKQLDALKGLSPLLLEIPFFMAAYHYLSHLSMLQGAAFGIIPDLGVPDGLISIHGFHINLLPILMTVINIISSILYTKDAPLKTKIQLYGMAALFLVLLYQSPAGLVFYWTLNNLFSLVKNIFLKLKDPKRGACIFSSAVGVLGLAFVLFIHPLSTVKKQVFLCAVLLLMQLPLLFRLFLKKHPVRTKLQIGKKEKTSFFLCCAFLALLTGALIPSAVIKSSPAEFVDAMGYNPVFYVLASFLLTAGIFLVWLPVFYAISGSLGKRIMSVAVWFLSGITLVDYMFFGADYGTLRTNLTYFEMPAFIGAAKNILLIVCAAALFLLIYKKFPSLMRYVCGTLALVTLVMSGINIAAIQKGYRETMAVVKHAEGDGELHIIPLSKSGKNVVVLMMDRAISSYIPYIFNEKPEVAKQFEGFTYYPNTISYGGYTNVGTPSLFGGYDYTPENMNKRDQELLQDKQNEALKVMPLLFDENDFDVTVCDPSYANYQWVPDLSIYDEYPDIHTYHTNGKYRMDTSEKGFQERREKLNRSMFCYSMFRVSPVFLQPYLYGNGTYNMLADFHARQDLSDPVAFESYVGEQTAESTLKATGISVTFYNAYTVLERLPMLTSIREGSENTFMMMSSEATHEICYLQEPDYVPYPFVDNTEYEAAHGDRFVLDDGSTIHMETENQIVHYQVNMSSMIQLGKWFDYMRENDLYDNTRIIIVSDHGRSLSCYDDWLWGEEEYQDTMLFNPLLMVKDFNSTEFTTDTSFMTNADVPAIAMEGLIEDPVNPFTKHPITKDEKFSQPLHILFSPWDISKNNSTTFDVSQWLEFEGDQVNDVNNWKLIWTPAE